LRLLNGGRQSATMTAILNRHSLSTEASLLFDMRCEESHKTIVSDQ